MYCVRLQTTVALLDTNLIQIQQIQKGERIRNVIIYCFNPCIKESIELNIYYRWMLTCNNLLTLISQSFLCQCLATSHHTNANDIELYRWSVKDLFDEIFFDCHIYDSQPIVANHEFLLLFTQIVYDWSQWFADYAKKYISWTRNSNHFPVKPFPKDFFLLWLHDNMPRYNIHKRTDELKACFRVPKKLLFRDYKIQGYTKYTTYLQNAVHIQSTHKRCK